MSFLQHLIANARQRGLFDGSNRRVLVACSGGADSLLLLHALWAAREELGLHLSVLTCDHGLRAESAAEVQEVRRMAWSLGLPCRVVEFPAVRKNISVEMQARELRRAAYVETARAFGAGCVALGHHRDDQAETVLLRLCRGTGTRGAAGMAGRAALADGIDLVRPLLPFSRAEIEAQCRSWRLPVLEDASNRDCSFVRNRVRHEILPLLHARVNSEAAAHIASFAEQQGKLEAWFAEEARRRGRSCREGGALRLERWRKQPEVLRERLLVDWLHDHGADPQRVDQAVLQRLCRLLATPLKRERRLREAGLQLRVSEDRMEWERPLPTLGILPLPAENAVLWPTLGRRIALTPAKEIDREASRARDVRGPLTAFVRPPPPGASFALRLPRRGDRYRPLGLQGSAKLSDLFINAKVPPSLRARWPVLVCGEEIVWVPGFRVAEDWKAVPGRCLRVEMDVGASNCFGARSTNPDGCVRWRP